jgi:hypothetical protein
MSNLARIVRENAWLSRSLGSFFVNLYGVILGLGQVLHLIRFVSKYVKGYFVHK